MTTTLTKPLALSEQPPHAGIIKHRWFITGLLIGLITISGCTTGNTKNTANAATMAALATHASSAPLDSKKTRPPTDLQTIEGDEAFAVKDYEQALNSYKIAIKGSPSQPNAWFGVAAAADMLGQFDISDLAYQHLKTTHQKSSRYLNNLGYSHMLRGDLLIAREYFLKVFELDPNNEEAQSNLDMLKHVVQSNPYDGQN